MVKPEDMSRFVGHIRLEAQRLVTLIGDIIRLSQLDEGGDMPRENVDLLSVASAVADDLLPSADGQGISIAVEGFPANVYGVKRLLYEIVYNLCDNAIKYNRQGGSVKISTVSEASPPSPFPIPESASRPSIRTAYSSASSGWIRAIPSLQAVPGLAFP